MQLLKSGIAVAVLAALQSAYATTSTTGVVGKASKLMITQVIDYLNGTGMFTS